MKKFVRFVTLLSVVLAVIYFVSFVNECNQLRNTFGTFLLFNDSGNVKPCVLGNDSVKSEYVGAGIFDSPLPVWTKVNEVHVYSAFWSNMNENFAVALGVGPSIADSSDYSCHVWFDLRNIIHSASGSLNILSFPSETNPKMFVHNFVCHINEDDLSGKPYLLILIHTDNEKKMKRSMIPIFSQESDSSVNKIAICVLPDRAGVGKASVVEFISFHQLVGLTDLLVYGGDANLGVINKVKRFAGVEGFLRSVALLPWNFPFDDLSLEIKLIESDCSLRTRGITQAFALLEWDQYIVTRQGSSVLSLLPAPSPTSNFNYQFRSEICCLEHTSDKRAESSWPIVLQKTHCMDYPFFSLFKAIGPKGLGTMEVSHNFTSSVSIKTYRSCLSLADVKTRYDHSPLKFLSGLLHNNLMILWNSGKLF